MLSYSQQTTSSPNPLARYAHLNRIKRSLKFAIPRIGIGKILDYGCGSGVFVSKINNFRSDTAVGYEPFMEERTDSHLPIFSTFEEVVSRGPYHTVTLFETIEHLADDELDEFLSRCDKILTPDGAILISAPIEIGPVLFLKEMNRTVLRRNKSDYHFGEFLRAALLGQPGRRAAEIKYSHKGFDFRKVTTDFAKRNWKTKLMGYGPLPVPTWYGNSQVYLIANRA